MAKTKRNPLHWKKKPENLNSEAINVKRHIRDLTYEQRHILGLTTSDIASGVRNGHFDGWEPVWGKSLKRWAKKMASKAWRRLGLQKIKEQLEEK